MTKSKKVKKSKNTPEKFSGDLLHRDNKENAKKKNLIPALTKRRARYWCYRFREFTISGVPIEDAPTGFKDFVENLPGFTEWEKFATTWDLVMLEDNNFMIVHRILSVWQEWDHVMDRVAIPVNATREEVEARVEALTRDFARQYGG